MILRIQFGWDLAMNRIQALVLVVAWCIPGCATLTSASLMSSKEARRDVTASPDIDGQAGTNDLPTMVTLGRDELEFNILPIGSYVTIQCGQQLRYQGTIVRRNRSHLDLANCLRMSAIVGADDSVQLVTECVPRQVVEEPTVTRVTIMSLPSPKFNPPGMKFKGEESEVVAVEFHSGRVQSWIEPQIEDRFRGNTDSAEVIARAIEEVQPGSQIAFTDSSGKRYNALVSSTASRNIDLHSCCKKETFHGRDGRETESLTLVPACSFDIESISSFNVVAAPLAGFDTAEFDNGCDVCVADVIYRSGRRQSQWKLARDDARMLKYFDQEAGPAIARNQERNLPPDGFTLPVLREAEPQTN